MSSTNNGHITLVGKSVFVFIVLLGLGSFFLFFFPSFLIPYIFLVNVLVILIIFWLIFDPVGILQPILTYSIIVSNLPNQVRTIID